MQGVDVNDKHIEVIVRQMMRKVRVDDAGDTTLLAGSMVDKSEFETANEEIEARVAAGETESSSGYLCTGFTWYYEGFPRNGFFPLCGILPGDHESAHRCGN